MGKRATSLKPYVKSTRSRKTKKRLAIKQTMLAAKKTKKGKKKRG